MPTDPPFDATPVLAALLHKLGSPLGAVANYACLIEGGDAAEAIDGIQSGVGRAKTLMGGARRWIDALRRVAGPEATDPAGVVSNAAEAEARPLEVEVGELPPLRVPTDAWSQICRELFANATQAADDLVTVAVAATVREGTARISFRDNGPGWSGTDAVRAFGYFVTLDTSSQRGGMGLPIVADLAARHGGRAWGAPRTDGGAVVHVELPAVV